MVRHFRKRNDSKFSELKKNVRPWFERMHNGKLDKLGLTYIDTRSGDH